MCCGKRGGILGYPTPIGVGFYTKIRTCLHAFLRRSSNKLSHTVTLPCFSHTKIISEFCADECYPATHRLVRSPSRGLVLVTAASLFEGLPAQCHAGSAVTLRARRNAMNDLTRPPPGRAQANAQAASPLDLRSTACGLPSGARPGPASGAPGPRPKA